MVQINCDHLIIPLLCRYTLCPLSKVKHEREERRRGGTERIPLELQKPAHYLYGKLNTNDFVQRLATQGVTDAKVDITSFSLNSYKIKLISFGGQEK